MPLHHLCWWHRMATHLHYNKCYQLTEVWPWYKVMLTPREVNQRTANCMTLQTRLVFELKAHTLRGTVPPFLVTSEEKLDFSFFPIQKMGIIMSNSWTVLLNLSINWQLQFSILVQVLKKKSKKKKIWHKANYYNLKWKQL